MKPAQRKFAKLNHLMIVVRDAAKSRDWYVKNLGLKVEFQVPAQGFVAQHLATYRDFPPRQKPGSFNLERVLEKLQEAGRNNN